MPKPTHFETLEYPRTLLIGVQAPYNKTTFIKSYIDEFENLVKTSGVPYEDNLFIKIREIDSTYFFTKGKLESIKEACEKNQIAHVIVSEPLTPRQGRNLEEFLNVSIFDRTDLILDIFQKAAVSAEGKTQVAIAKFQHEKSRLAGKGLFLEQQMGAKGVRSGPGETMKEKERRYIDDEIRKLKKQLEKMQTVRSTQRKKRVDSRIPHICIIGYTNAGKSTILNTLTNSDVLAADKLFATLDTTTRELFIDGKKKGVISDTVGFIQQLPHQLIEAFKSTLSELQFADLLIQVVDLSDPNWESHIQIVHEILEDLDVHKEMLYVFNKVDTLESPGEISTNIENYRPHVIVSALSRSGLNPLIKFLALWEKEAD